MISKSLEKLTEKKLEDILYESGNFPADKIHHCQEIESTTKKPLNQVVLEEGLIEEDKLAEMLALRLQLPYLSLDNYTVSQELIQAFPKHLMIKHQFLPLSQVEDILTIVIPSALSRALLEDLEKIMDSEPMFYIGKLSQIMKFLQEYTPATGEQAVEETSEAPEEEMQADSMSFEDSLVIFRDADDNIQKSLKDQHARMMASGSPSEILAMEEQGMVDDAPEFPTETGQPSLTSAWENELRLLQDEVSAAVPGDIQADAFLEEPIVESKRPEQQKTEQKRMPAPAPAAATPAPTAPAAASTAKASPSESKKTSKANEDPVLASLAEHLTKNPTDYEAINRYVEIALERQDTKAAVRQLTLFAWGLDNLKKIEEAINCYQYILSIDPNNREAKKRLGL